MHRYVITYMIQTYGMIQSPLTVELIKRKNTINYERIRALSSLSAVSMLSTMSFSLNYNAKQLMN